jgi:hypothetical protein
MKIISLGGEQVKRLMQLPYKITALIFVRPYISINHALFILFAECITSRCLPIDSI